MTALDAVLTHIRQLQEIRAQRAERTQFTVEERLEFLEGALAALVEVLSGGAEPTPGPSLEERHRSFVDRIRAAERGTFGGNQ